MTFRINGTHRAHVVTAAITSAFKQRREATLATEHVLALDCYAHVFAPDERAAVAALVSGWAKEVDSMQVSFRGNYYRLQCPRKLRIPYTMSTPSYVPRITDTALIERWERLEMVKTTLSDDVDRATAQLKVLLNQFGSLKSLSEGWPEGAEFYKDLQPPPDVALPVVQMTAINEMLGLTPKA